MVLFFLLIFSLFFIYSIYSIRKQTRAHYENVRKYVARIEKLNKEERNSAMELRAETAKMIKLVTDNSLFEKKNPIES